MINTMRNTSFVRMFVLGALASLTLGCMCREQPDEKIEPNPVPQHETLNENSKDTTMPQEQEVVEASVMMVTDYSDRIRVGIHLCEDKKLIDDLILAPIRNAKTDPEPAKYIYVGGLVVKNKDGSETCYALYEPWGHFSRENNYYITDFEKLPQRSSNR